MEQEQNKGLTVPLAIVVAGALVAGAIFLSGRGNENADLAGTGGAAAAASGAAAPSPFPTSEIQLKPVDPNEHFLGNPAANIIVVEYSDLECPFCKVFHATMHQIMSEYGKSGKVAWVYRHFPLDSLHPKARHEAEATECTTEQGGNAAFWKYVDKIFEITPSNNRLDPALLSSTAKEIGIDQGKFETCLASGKYAAAIQASYDDGAGAGADGTPFSVLISRGKKFALHGAEPYAVVKTKIEELLK